MSFIKIPYLPNKKVEICIAGSGIIKFENELNRLGVSIIKSDINQNVDTPISNHADVSVNYVGDGNFFLDSTQNSLFEQLSVLGANVNYIKEISRKDYPYDCLLNCLIDSKSIICNEKYVSKDILSFANESGLRTINTNQGYTKCSTVSVFENAYITDDESIYKSLIGSKYDALLVKKGSVELKGYNYGFIGGTCGKISKNELVFFGSIERHSSYDSIKSFCGNYKVDLISIGNGQLEDIGSLIPIIEKE